VESTVDQLVDWRMEKKQHMRWTQRGAQMLLHARCALLNGELGKYTLWSPSESSQGAGGGGMNPQVLSSPDLTENRHFLRMIVAEGELTSGRPKRSTI
jgi:hypothetical protein